VNNEYNIKLPTPHPKQKEILNAYFNSKVKNITINAGRRGGKSTIMSIIAIVEACNGKQIAYICPQYSQAKFFFNEILKLLPINVAESNKSDLEISFITGGQIKFYSGNGDSLDGTIRGRNYDLAIVDESAFISLLQEKLDGAIGATLTDRDGRLLMISTPYGKNYWFELCQKNDGVLWSHFHYTTYDNPYIKREVIDRFRQQLSKAQFAQEYLAIAGENASAIVDSDVIERNTITELSTNQTVVYGIDIATSPQGDYTSITGLDANGHMTEHQHYRGFDPNLLEGIIKNLPSGIIKAIDKTGIGDGLFYRLQMVAQNVIGVHFDTSTKLNLITELRVALNTDKLKFNEITAKELSTYIATLNPKTHNISFNSISGCFDDTVISLSLANFYLEEGKAMHDSNGNPLAKYGW